MDTLISLILPIYNEGKNIEELYQRSRAVLEKTGDYEIIFVNDGSSDDSLEKIVALSRLNSRVKLVDFSRNFGHQIAITAGLDFALGDAVVIMDSDLQDTPETIAEMVAAWREGYDVVYAKRRTRQDGFFKKATAFIFYRILKKLANIDIPEDTGDFRLISREVADHLMAMGESNKFLRGQIAWLGFSQVSVDFERQERKAGETKYTLRRMMRFAMDGITSFSNFPLQIATFLGFLFSLFAFFIILYALYSKFILKEVVTGWTSLMISTMFIGGIQLLCIGIIGEYISRISSDVKRRPPYVIEETNCLAENAGTGKGEVPGS